MDKPGALGAPSVAAFEPQAKTRCRTAPFSGCALKRGYPHNAKPKRTRHFSAEGAEGAE